MQTESEHTSPKLLPLPHPAAVLDQVFTPRECEALISAAEATGFSATGLLYPADYRNNDRLVIDDEGLAAALFRRVQPLLPPVRDERGRLLEPVGMNARFRFCRYSGGQRFGIHRDGQYCRPNGDASRLVCQVYLNDAGEQAGGRTRFFAGPHDTTPILYVQPSEGRAIIFDHQLWHDGEPVTRGTKYVMRTDVIYHGAAPTSAHTGYIWKIVRAPDGALFTASRDGTIRRWRNGVSEASVQGPGGSVTALALGPDGRVHGATREGIIFLADFTSGGFVEISRLASAVLDLTVLPSGELASACADGSLCTAGARRSTHTGWATALAYLPRRGLIASVGNDGSLVLSRASDLGEIARYEHGAPLTSLAASDFRLWLGDATGCVTELSLACDDLRRAWSARLHTGPVTALARQGDRLASGGEDFYLRVWDVRQPQHALASTRHTDFVRGVVWTDDHSCISAGYDAVLRTTEQGPN